MSQAVLVERGLSVDYTPGSDVSAGQVVVQSRLVGVAASPIPSGVLGALQVTGIFDVASANEAFNTVGAPVYWDADGNPYGGTPGSGCATATPTANTFMGLVVKTAGATAGKVRILLRSSVALAAEVIGLGDLADVAAVAYTAGHILVADGATFDDVALSGDAVLSGAGVLTVNKLTGMLVPSATVAADGSNQGDAPAVAVGFTLVSAANATKGVKLPAAAAGKVCIIKNLDSANAVLKVYPNTDDAINAIAANTEIALAAKTCATFYAYDATTWYTCPLLPS